ncbi:MAG TPA: hypothetical protein VFQ31_03430 [Methyloceanibacter sp.]|nr:hypothetical protein [Methyloceanibacter sp.]
MIQILLEFLCSIRLKGEWPMGAGIVLIAVVALAILCAAAALPRGLLMAVFVTLIATAAVVIMFEVAPTENSPAVVVNHIR